MVKQLAIRRSLLLSYKRRVYQISEYLGRGEYIVDVKKRIVYKNDSGHIRFLTKKLKCTPNDFSGKQHVINSLFATCRVLIRKDSKNDFTGSLVLFSNKNRNEKQFGDLKIFDFSKRQILTSYKSIESYQKRQKDTLHFYKHFQLPEVYDQRDDLLITTEEMIEFVPHNNYQRSDYLSIAAYLLDNYLQYFKKEYSGEGIKTVKSSSFFEYNQIHPVNLKNIQKIRAMIDSSLLQQDIPLCYEHGDLSISNILYTRTNDVFLIDWEHASYFSFLYDIMWFWQNEAIFRNNYWVLEHYFYGGFDKFMNQIFRCFELNYCAEHRLSYFLIMIAELIKHRVLKTEPSRYNVFLNDKVMLLVEEAVELRKPPAKLHK